VGDEARDVDGDEACKREALYRKLMDLTTIPLGKADSSPVP